MKTLIQILCAFFLILVASPNLFSQEIEIDFIFTGDTVLYPFEGIETISEMTIDGDVRLTEVTSLIRVILEDESGYQYMIFESYPLICPDLEFSFANHCDETCFLDELHPYSLIIQVIEAQFYLKSLFYSTEPKQNASEQRYAAKRAKDEENLN
jgi:hypothetical protein